MRFVFCVRVHERKVALRERESGRDASWKMTAFTRYVGGKTFHYIEKKGEKKNKTMVYHWK